MSQSALSWRTTIGYSLGHVFNDLTGSFWFSYSLLLFKLQISSQFAGALIFIGQATDAIGSLATGFVSDKTSNKFFERYGRLKSYHLIGTILVAISFPFLYNHCLGCQHASDGQKFAYYVGFVVLFQLGWGSVEVSHLSLISKLTDNSKQRLSLFSFRQAANVVASIIVYSTVLVLLQSNVNPDSSSRIVSREDLPSFMIVSLVLAAIGLLISVLFHVLVRENSPIVSSDNETSSMSSDTGDSTNDLFDEATQQIVHNKQWFDWLKDGLFYRVGFLYIICHLSYNLSQTYTPIFLQYTLKTDKHTLATVPFVTYSVGFVSSFITKYLATKYSSKFTLLLGIAFAMAFAIWIQLAGQQLANSWQLYAVTGLNGIAGTTLLISSLTLISDLTSSQTEQSAFVFGAIGFVDKLANGVAILCLESWLPEPDAIEDNSFYRHVIVSAAAIGCCLIFVGFLSICWVSVGRQPEGKNCRFYLKLTAYQQH